MAHLKGPYAASPPQWHTSRPTRRACRNSRCRSARPNSARTSRLRRPRAISSNPNTCSHPFCPKGVLFYEHMFCSSPESHAPQRLVRTLRLVRSFLLLEDDYGVDWEVDQEGHTKRPGVAIGDCDDRLDDREGAHPHRMALRSRLGARRPGVVAGAEQVCLCPVGERARAGVSRGSLPPKRSCADVPCGTGSSGNR